jgi:hypothetical protein
MAQGGALSFLWVGVTLVILIAIVAAGFGLWSLRPLPGYASESVETGSPFDVTFRIENTSAWFPLAHLAIECVLTRGSVPEIAPVAASDVRFPSGGSPNLAPGESATFRCPFRAELEKSSQDELGVALRSEIYFRSAYDLPLAGSYRITDSNGPYVLNTRLLPPRWTGKPND